MCACVADRGWCAAAGMYICNSFQTFYSNNPTSVYTGTCSPSSSDYQGGHAVKIVG